MPEKIFFCARLACLLALVCGSAVAKPVVLDIEPQPLAEALKEFVSQSGLQVLYPADSGVQRLESAKIEGKMTPDAALDQMLAGTGFSYNFVNKRTVAIHKTKAIPEVLVKGTQSLNADIRRTEDDVQPYVVFDRKAIERTTRPIDRLKADKATTPVAQPDSNGIPFLPIERIEVLPTTASGIYGGSATGGVVNSKSAEVRSAVCARHTI